MACVECDGAGKVVAAIGRASSPFSLSVRQ